MSEETPGNPALRRELLDLVEQDQAARKAAIATQFKDARANAQIEAIDGKTSARMKEVVAAYGWPGKSLVGKDGASAAWLLVQHADRDRAFQRVCLEKMQAQLARGEVEPRDYAYLVDRVAVGEKRKQTYGTQFDEQLQPQPIEDEAHVDERRKAVGLAPLAEYKQQMIKMYGPPN